MVLPLLDDVDDDSQGSALRIAKSIKHQHPLNSLKSKMLKVLGLDSALLKGCNSKLKLSFMPIVKVQHFAGLLILHLVNGPTLKDSESLSLSI